MVCPPVALGVSTHLTCPEIPIVSVTVAPSCAKRGLPPTRPRIKGTNMTSRMIYTIPQPLGMLRNHCSETNLNFLSSCPRAQPQRGCEEETRSVELPTHVEFSSPAKLV